MIAVYVAGASSEYKRASELAGQLLATGQVSLADRWWENAASWSGKDQEHSPEARRRITRQHFANIEECDVLFFLAPSKNHHSRMAWAELGYAQAQSRALTIIVSGECAAASACTALCDRMFLSDDEALRHIVDLARNS